MISAITMRVLFTKAIGLGLDVRNYRNMSILEGSTASRNRYGSCDIVAVK